MSDRLDELDYYTLLSVAAEASADQVKRAFHVFARKYHPDRFVAAPPEKRERAAQIYRRGTEAYRVLCDPTKRRRYDETLKQGALRYDPTEERAGDTRASRAAAKIAPKARPFVQKAEQAQKAGDLRTAKLNYKIALQHDPDNAELKEKLAEVEQKLAG
jgi:curved DNA-binding protein CbpA